MKSEESIDYSINHLIGTMLASLPMAKTAKTFLTQLYHRPSSACISVNNYMVLRFIDGEKRAVVEIDHDGDVILYLTEPTGKTIQHYTDTTKLAQDVMAYMEKL